MRGVFFLANDRVYDQAVAFLASFRMYNPAIPLCLIPFADNSEKVRALTPAYRFTVYEDPEILATCDEIGLPFHGERLGMYRKLAIWSGPFDEFLYIDCDTVVLQPVDFVFELTPRYDFITSHSHIPTIRRYVWRDSIYQAGALTNEQIGYSANTGFIASRRGLLDVRKIAAELDAPLALAEHMELDCYEQPVLNYLIVTSGGSYTSLFDIKMRTRRRDIPLERWAGRDIGKVSGGRIIFPRHPRTLLVHWAGEWERARLSGKTIPHYDLWWYYRSMYTEEA